MCGLCGVVNFNQQEVAPELLHQMNTYTKERGPDSSGVWHTSSLGFGHTRLKIIDLDDRADQPMVNPDLGLAVIFNGEIYNFPQLKQELRVHYTFKTTSDTEVLLAGYRVFGIDKLLQRLEGMYAFALADTGQNRVYLARDRFGKKPLYYHHSAQTFRFSSDIRAVASTLESISLDPESLDYYLTELSVPQPKTIYREIKQVPPATYFTLELETGACKAQKYWQLPARESQQKLRITEAEVLEQLEERLSEAIMKRTLADVPLGCFLSGGADSGLITALLATHAQEPVRTFTVSLGFNPGDESAEARKLANRYGTLHTEVEAQPEIADLLPALIEYCGEPFGDPSILPTYIICQEISRSVKVALSGDGGDEIFFGYHDYRWAAEADLLTSQYPNAIGRGLAVRKSQLAHRLGWTNRNLGSTQAYIQMPGWERLHRTMGFHPGQKTALYHADFQNGQINYARDYLAEVWQENYQFSILDSLGAASLNTRLLNDYLVKVDRASMYNSLEVRSPFLDHKLAEWVWQLPNELKLKHGTPKYLLKKLATRYIDPDFFNRKKQGFGLPLNSWLKGSLKEMAFDTLLSAQMKERRIFNPQYVETILQEHLSGRQAHDHRIWALLCLELWLNSASKVNQVA